MVLVWIIADIIAAGVAGFAVTTLTGGKGAHPESVPGGTDVLSGGIIYVRRAWRPRCVWLRVLLLGCRPSASSSASAAASSS